ADGATAGAGGAPSDPIADSLATAIYAYRSKDFAGVIESVDRILSSDPQHAMALEVGGFAANQARDWDAATRYWGALTALQENRQGPRLQLVSALIEKGDQSAALALVDPLLVRDPTSHDLIRIKLNILTRCDDSAGLVRFGQELGGMAWTKSDTALLERIGSSFITVQELASAKQWLDRARSLDPANTAALQLQARIAYAERQYGLASELCEQLERDGVGSQRTEARLIQARIAHLLGEP